MWVCGGGLRHSGIISTQCRVDSVVTHQLSTINITHIKQNLPYLCLRHLSPHISHTVYLAVFPTTDNHQSNQIKCIYKALLTSVDVTKCCTETQPKTPKTASNAGVESTVARKKLPGKAKT